MKRILYLLTILLFFAPSLVSAATLAQPNTSALAQGLVGYWPLDGATTNWGTGTTRDISGLGNNGNLVGLSTTTTPSAGKLGQAFSLSGASGKGIMIPAITMGTTFTYSVWMYTGVTSGTTDYGNLLTQNASLGIWYRFFPQKVSFYYSGADHLNTTAMAINKWHHVVVVNSAGNVTFYIDGVANGTATSGTSFNANGMGCDNNGSGVPVAECMIGKLDDARIYNRALSAQEVALLYAAGTAKIDQVPLPSTSTFNFGLNAGLVGYWPLDGATTNWRTNTTADMSGSGNTGRFVSLSTTTSPSAGKIGGALTFNGTNQYINAGNASIANFGPNQNFSIAFWMKTTASPASAKPFAKSDVDSITAGWGFYQSGFTLFLKIADGTSSRYEVGLTGINDGKWHYITYSINRSGNCNRYRDGVLIGTTGCSSWASADLTNSLNLTMGANSPANGYWQGSLDDVKIYNRALTAQEVGQLYSVGTANIAHSNTTTGTGLNAGLVGYWTMDGGSINWRANTITDQSGNGNSGTLISLATSTAPVAGKTGQALKFNGTSSTILLTTNSSVNSLVNNLTISAWIKVSSVGSQTRIICSASNGVCFTANGSGLIFTTQGVKNYSSTTITLPLNTWVHVTAVDSANNVSFYINGAYKETVTGTTPASTASGYYIGSNAGTANFFPGAIDDLRVYNRPLSAQEVQQLYTQGK